MRTWTWMAALLALAVPAQADHGAAALYQGDAWGPGSGCRVTVAAERLDAESWLLAVAVRGAACHAPFVWDACLGEGSLEEGIQGACAGGGTLALGGTFHPHAPGAGVDAHDRVWMDYWSAAVGIDYYAYGHDGDGVVAVG